MQRRVFGADEAVSFSRQFVIDVIGYPIWLFTAPAALTVRLWSAYRPGWRFALAGQQTFRFRDDFGVEKLHQVFDAQH
jgi:hypothetical protein